MRTRPSKVKSSNKNLALKDAFFVNLWMKTLLALIRDQTFSSSFKINLLEAIVEKDQSKEELQSLLSILKGLFDLKAQDKLQGWEKASSLILFLKQKYIEAFQEVIPLSEVKEEEIQYLFQAFRDPQALLKYASALKKLPDSSSMLKELAACLEKLLDENFPACRYEESIHLQVVFGSPSSLKKMWMQEKISPLFIHSSAKQQESDENFKIVNTDNAVDLFLCGTEVEGSCQRIDGDPAYNKCLLGYVMDGKNRLLAIKDKEEKIKARCIMRLLWDAEQQQSVLFLERIYPVSAKEEWKQALEQEAIMLAKELSVPLVSKEVSQGRPYPHPVQSLSSKASYEYVDALEKVTQGQFSISGGHFIASS